MENVQHFKMTSEMTGILINKINPLSDAHRSLKKDDVILAIDGVLIGNDETGYYVYIYVLFPLLKLSLVVLIKRNRVCCMQYLFGIGNGLPSIIWFL